MNVKEFLKKISADFSEAGIDTPETDAQVILSDFLHVERYWLTADDEKNLSDSEIEELGKLCGRRIKGEPVAYITGRKEFYSLEFIVNRHVLIPRPETELLVDLAVFHANKNGTVLDLGTGSGAIAVGLKHSRDDLIVIASDISREAVSVAMQNGIRLLQHNSPSFICGDLFMPFKNNRFDMIITNPPYLDPAESGLLQRELSYEPVTALFSGNRGREIVGKIISQSTVMLKENGIILMEIAPGIADFIIKTGKKHGFSVSILNDYAGLPRIGFFSFK